VGVKRDRRADTKRSDLLDQAVGVFFLLNVKRDEFGFQRREEVDKKGIVFHHQVDVKRFGSGFGRGLYHHRPDGHIGHEVAVHYVYMDIIGAGFANRVDLFIQAAEISR
jgi:hypothetical protein